MLKEIDLKHKISKQDYDTAFDAMSVKLGALERKIRDAGIQITCIGKIKKEEHGVKMNVEGELIEIAPPVSDEVYKALAYKK